MAVEGGDRGGKPSGTPIITIGGNTIDIPPIPTPSIPSIPDISIPPIPTPHIPDVGGWDKREAEPDLTNAQRLARGLPLKKPQLARRGGA